MVPIPPETTEMMAPVEMVLRIAGPNKCETNPGSNPGSSRIYLGPRCATPFPPAPSSRWFRAESGPFWSFWSWRSFGLRFDITGGWMGRLAILNRGLMSFERANHQSAAEALAKQGVFIGTSSWKYPGWRGQLYDESRYLWRGSFSEARFKRDCLAEYAEVFKTVCVDAAYYKFPDRRYLDTMMTAVQDDFLFGFKVTDEI